MDVALWIMAVGSVLLISFFIFLMIVSHPDPTPALHACHYFRTK